MENGTQLAVQQESSMAPLSARDIREQVNLIQSVMKEVMQEKQHYGKIPGCGDKPTLLKSGAEKLSMVFRLRPIIDNDRDVNVQDLGDGHREYRVYCHVMNASGLELATGVGSCSTKESKYRYRGGEKIPTGALVPTEYWNLKNEGKKEEAQKVLGGSGFGVAKIEGQWQICEMGAKMENPDIADTYNTVLKMAKKRAYIDGILSATAASDIFTQDIEDMPELHKEQAAPAQASATPAASQKPSTPTNGATTPAKPSADPASHPLPGPSGEKIYNQIVIKEVTVQQKFIKSKNKKAPMWTVIMPDGAKADTFYEPHANIAIRSRDEKLPVAVKIEPAKYGYELSDIGFTTAPKASGDMPNDAIEEAEVL